MHKHHRVPKYRGGTDEPSNIIEVRVEQHAELHFALYLEDGHWQDWVAYHALSGQMSMSEASQEAIRRGQINSQKHWTPEKRRAAAKKAHTEEANAKRTATMTGKKRGKYTIRNKRTDFSGTTGRKPQPVKFGDTTYTSMKECASDLGIPLHTAYHWRQRGKIQ